ncbi:MAG TPA: sterol desaturase family protein [Candidatus Polarisedimenticolia bacterium]|nr:sterol desaturase family protein [Candidatus Polarisedimenticolia bacterium]
MRSPAADNGRIDVSYIHWLTGVSLVFVLLERLFPWRAEQPLLRPGWRRDFGFIALNGHLFPVWTAALNGGAAAYATSGLRSLGIEVGASGVGAWPFLAQTLALLVVADFLQWCVHNLLHRVPWLWTFHKVHHSIATMDWIGNWRFHWMEIVVYKSAQWLPLAWLGASPQAAFTVAVITTFWGEMNHANLSLGLGPLGCVLNTPRMHLWHHDWSSEGGVSKNFGVVLSVWDFLFGTAYWPRDRHPERLGYPAMEEMPEGFVGQALWPLTRRAAATRHPVPAAAPGPPASTRRT